MRNARAVAVQVLIIAGLCALAWLQLELPAIAHFDFPWGLLLGILLGVLLALLPALAGFPVRPNALAGMYWAGAFILLLLVVYQYLSMVTGLHLDALRFISQPAARLRIVEGALLGFCVTQAMRGTA